MLNVKTFWLGSLTLLLFLLITPQLYSEELNKWPRDVKVSSGSITIYQPQIESLEGNILKARAAIAYHGSGSDSPVFGAAWFTSQVHIDRENRTVHYETIEVTGTRFPEENKQLAEEFGEAVQQGVKSGNLTSSLDELTTALAAVEQQQKQAADLKNDPPEIIYMDRPALLITIDGKTMLQKVESSVYQAVANTPYPLFFDEKKKVWYLNAADKVWYQAKSADGPWVLDENPPRVLVQMVASKAKQSDDSTKESTTPITAANAPAIVVAHTPTELIVSDGKADFTPITDDLLAMSNTDSQVFMDVKSQKYFLVISGRWYRSSAMDGKWHYVASDKLPATFAEIPKDSKYADVRSYVANTDEAKEAVMDAQIPQTAAVKRGAVDIKLTYDGKPQFKKIDGTTLQFAVNCSETVIVEGKKYYLVKDAVWYVSDSATGPWVVSDHAPPGIDNVPPSSPVYNTKYVYVYDSTPEMVYVGYTPGYVGSYIYGPTIVYGTGWYYNPWIAPYYYYPRPATWGLSVSYNPWTGWGFGMSWSSGPFRFGFYTGGGYHGRYWGGRRYYGPRGYRPSFNQVNINNININTRRNFNNFSTHNNLYRNTNQRATIQNSINSRSISTSDRQNIKNRMSTNRSGGSGVNRQAPNTVSTRQLSTDDMRNKAANLTTRNRTNNILTDEKGNVLRNNNGQWQQRDQGQWQNRTSSATTEKTRSNIQQRSGYDRSSSIDRQQYSRQRATERTQNYSRPSSGSHRGGGGGRSRGGGGRRR
jgi:hypothetical protein